MMKSNHLSWKSKKNKDVFFRKSEFSFLGMLFISKVGLHQTLDSGIKFPKTFMWEWLNGFFNEMKVLSSASLWWNPIIQVENKKNQDSFSKKSRFSFLVMFITSEIGQKFSCDSGLMNFSMKCKSFPLLAQEFNFLKFLCGSGLTEFSMKCRN